MKVEKFLADHEYIEGTKGYPAIQPNQIPQFAKMRATEKLSTLFDAHDLTDDMVRTDTSNKEIIVLKGFKPPVTWKTVNGKSIPKEHPRPIIPTPDTPEVQQMRKNLEQINAQIASADISLDVTEDEWKLLNQQMIGKGKEYREVVDFSKKQLKRSFLNERFDRGGRFSDGWWMSVKRWARKHITINNNQTIEADFSSQYPHMLYAHEGLPLSEDPYTLDYYLDVDGTTRTFVKACLLRSFGADGRKATVKSIEKSVRDGELIQPESITNINLVLDALAAKHKPISKFMHKGISDQLQYYDSVIAERVMLKFAERGIAALPVHDSFIVEEQYKFEIDLEMMSAFRWLCGQFIKVDYKKPIDRTELEAHAEQFISQKEAEISHDIELIKAGLPEFKERMQAKIETEEDRIKFQEILTRLVQFD